MGIDWKVHTYAQLPSTQDYIRDLAAEDFPEGVVIQCLTQTRGRGRLGNQWDSPMGNLYMSILLRPDCAADRAGQISFIAAVALSAAMDDVTRAGHVKTLKWPNDVLIDGKKCAGILLESDVDPKGLITSLALGIGVNIMAAPEGRIGLRDVAKGAGGVPVHPFRDLVLSHFAAYYMNWKQAGFADIRARWLAQAHGLGQAVTARLGTQSFEGIFRDLDEGGALLLEQEDGKIIKVSSGEVYFPVMQDA